MSAAILLEPIQGESGIRPATAEFLRGLRQLCDQHNLLLMFDEVQCGVGCTGEFCAFRAIAPDVQPVAVSWAKGLSGGFPIGAFWIRESLGDVLGPRTHGTTYGGTPLGCAVALKVIEIIERDRLADHARTLGDWFKGELLNITSQFPGVLDQVRGLGLILGLQLREASDIPAFASQDKPVSLQSNESQGVPARPPAGPRAG